MRHGAGTTVILSRLVALSVSITLNASLLQAYGVVVLWKVVCATRLVLDPESLAKLVELFFIHHIYVWCRAFISIMETVGIFEEVTYTVGILFAGFVCIPMTIGPGKSTKISEGPPAGKQWPG